MLISTWQRGRRLSQRSQGRRWALRWMGVGLWLPSPTSLHLCGHCGHCGSLIGPSDKLPLIWVSWITRGSGRLPGSLRELSPLRLDLVGLWVFHGGLGGLCGQEIEPVCRAHLATSIASSNLKIIPG